MKHTKHFFRFFLAFSLIFGVGILGLFLIHRFTGGGEQNSASLADKIKKIGGGN